MKGKKSKSNTRYKEWLVAAVFVLSLLTMSSAIWANRTFFNEDRFANTVTDVLQQESSREAIARRLTDQALENRPVAKKVLQERMIALISGVLDSDLASNAMYTAASRLQQAVVYSSENDIVIETTGLKDTIIKVQTVLDNQVGEDREQRIDAEAIPNEIVLLEQGSLPEFYRYQVVSLWVSPLAAVVAVLSVFYLYRRREKHIEGVRLIAQLVTLAGLIGWLFNPLMKPPFLLALGAESGRIIPGNLYDAFMAPYTAQSIALFVIGLTVWVGSYVYVAMKPQKKWFSKA